MNYSAGSRKVAGNTTHHLILSLIKRGETPEAKCEGKDVVMARHLRHDLGRSKQGSGKEIRMSALPAPQEPLTEGGATADNRFGYIIKKGRYHDAPFFTPACSDSLLGGPFLAHRGNKRLYGRHRLEQTLPAAWDSVVVAGNQGSKIRELIFIQLHRRRDPGDMQRRKPSPARNHIVKQSLA